MSQSPKSVYLIGFMGVGKTTLGRHLARKLNLPFFDLDELITQKTGLSPSAIFAGSGEPAFREVEASILRSLSGDFVLSTGGGCPCFHGNMDFMLGSGRVVYLRSSAAVLASRLEQNGYAERPLLAGKSHDELFTYVEDLLVVREPYYSRASCVVEIGLSENLQKLISNVLFCLT